MSHSDPQHDDENGDSNLQDYHVVRLRKRSCSEWMAIVIWLIVLGVLLEYAWSSIWENEDQAAILAGALFLGLLVAGMIVQLIRSVEARSLYRNVAPPQLTPMRSGNGVDEYEQEREETEPS